MSAIAPAQRARTTAVIAAVAAVLAVLGCSESGPLTAPTQARPLQEAATPASQAAITLRGPRLSGYALASGRIGDSLQTPLGK
jgi:hypothetical protein